MGVWKMQKERCQTSQDVADTTARHRMSHHDVAHVG